MIINLIHATMRQKLTEFKNDLREIDFLVRETIIDIIPRIITEKDRDLSYILINDLEVINKILENWLNTIIEREK